MFKTFFKVFILIGLIAYLVFALVKFSCHDKNQVCQGLDIQILDGQCTDFVNENEVRELLVSKKLFPEGRALDSINLAELESVLVASPYIDRALCYKTAQQTIMMRITPRIPILHVLNTEGDDFYIDNCGGTMPRGHHTIDLIVMSGHVDRATAGRRYSAIGMQLATDSFWQNQIEEIHVTPEGELEITPRVGDHIILLGDTSDFTGKLSRMKTFYTEGLNKAGWNKYKTISLKYAGQVVCTKR